MTDERRGSDIKVDVLEEKLDDHISIYSRHIEVYRENGKESKRVADILQQMQIDSALRDSKSALRDHKAAERDIRSDEMYKDFMDSKATSNSISRWMSNTTKVAAFIIAIVGIVAAIKWVLAQ